MRKEPREFIPECSDCQRDRKRNPFVAVRLTVMRGAVHIATASSVTMARRIAAALNRYTPGPKGY